jgi:hypothetical protein
MAGPPRGDPVRRPDRVLRHAPAVLAGGIGLSFLIFAGHAYPVPAGDAQAFLPPAILLEAGGGLRNPVSALTRQVDPTGGDRYLQYPPLFQVTLTALMTEPSPRAAFLALAALGALDLILAFLLFRRTVAPGARDHPWAAPLAVTAATAATATLLLGQQTGRPEGLATFWVLLGTHVFLSRGPAAWPVYGLLLGLLGATHPAGGFLAGLLLAAAILAFQPRLGEALRPLAGAAVLALALFALILHLGPWGLAETLAGIVRHADLALAGRDSTESLRTYWITNAGATFFALPCLLLLAILPAFLARRRPDAHPLFLPAVLLLAGAAWTLSLRAPELAYNLQLFAPLVFAGNLRAAFGGAPRRRLLQGISAGVHGLAAAGYVRGLILFYFFLSTGVSLDEARREFARIARTARIARPPVAVTSSLWVLSEDYALLRALPAATPAERIPGDLFVVQQSYSGLREPPALPGFHLVEEHFVGDACRLFGIEIARTVPGYGFAVYARGERSGSEPAQPPEQLGGGEVPAPAERSWHRP